MPRLAVHRLPMAHPGDVTALAALLAGGAVRAGEIRAVIGKTEGNGGLNDFTRGYFTQSLMGLLAGPLGATPEAVAARIPCVLSGGTEGALSPHYLVFCAEAEGPFRADPGGPFRADPGGASRAASVGASRAAPGDEAIGLAIGTAFSPPTPPWEVGRAAQVEAVAEAVRAAMARAGIAAAADVALVQVKAPAGTAPPPDGLRPGSPRSTDPRALMALSRAAAAFGVGVALGDIPAARATEAAMLTDLSLWSGRASISSGVEVTCNEVVVFGRARGWAPGVVAGVAPMADLLDLEGVRAAFRAAGAEGAPGRVLGVIAKGEPDRSGAIRGQRHTMLGDTDLDPQRHLRGALGAIVAAVAGDGRVFVSGGAEHQGPPGGGLVCVFARQG